MKSPFPGMSRDMNIDVEMRHPVCRFQRSRSTALGSLVAHGEADDPFSADLRCGQLSDLVTFAIVDDPGHGLRVKRHPHHLALLGVSHMTISVIQRDRTVA